MTDGRVRSWPPPGPASRPRARSTRNPVQDVTPAALVTAIVTERGTLRPPFADAIAGVVTVAATAPELEPAPAAEAVG